MDTDQIWNSLAKYFSGEASSQEKELVEEWRSKSEDNRKVFELFQSIWNSESDLRTFENFDLNNVWLDTLDKLGSEKFSPQIAGKDRGQETHKEKKKPLFQIKKFVKYAAVAVFLLAAILTGAFLYPFHDEAFSEGVLYKTEAGEVLNIELDDGSTVWLAPKSTLDLPSDFSTSTRKLQLEGEAYFSVENHQDIPFLVYTKNSVTKVLGTQFNVKALTDEDLLEVLVTEGIVAVAKGNRAQKEEDIILMEGDFLRTDEQLVQYLVLNEFNSLTYLKWRDGVIYLDNLPLSSVSERLERWYPVEVLLQSEDLASKELTAEFSSSQPLEDILDEISLALNIEYKRVQGTVIFY